MLRINDFETGIRIGRKALRETLASGDPVPCDIVRNHCRDLGVTRSMARKARILENVKHTSESGESCWFISKGAKL